METVADETVVKRVVIEFTEELPVVLGVGPLVVTSGVIGVLVSRIALTEIGDEIVVKSVVFEFTDELPVVLGVSPLVVTSGVVNVLVSGITLVKGDDIGDVCVVTIGFDTLRVYNDVDGLVILDKVV